MTPIRFKMNPSNVRHLTRNTGGEGITPENIEQAGRTYVRATVTAEAGYALIDAARVIGRSIWTLAYLGALAVLCIAIWKYAPAILRYV